MWLKAGLALRATGSTAAANRRATRIADALSTAVHPCGVLLKLSKLNFRDTPLAPKEHDVRRPGFSCEKNQGSHESSLCGESVPRWSVVNRDSYNTSRFEVTLNTRACSRGRGERIRDRERTEDRENRRVAFTHTWFRLVPRLSAHPAHDSQLAIFACILIVPITERGRHSLLPTLWL